MTLLFCASFLPAFLLFGVQPMATKMVLPALGGTPAVWNTAMLTFQVLLLAGYAYAHWLAKLSGKRQLVIHATLAAVSCVVLPLAVNLPLDETLLEHPIYHLVRAFLLQLGLPFLVLAATAPLLQSWVSRSSHKLAKTPYVLYSASNLGSFAALLGYVIFIEPQFTLDEQRWGWSVCYVTALGLLLFTGYQLKLRALPKRAPAKHKRIPARQYALWIWLAFLPSSLMLGVTSYLTTDIASVPLLWIIPLALYLLAFVDAFRSKPLATRTAMRMAPLAGMALLILYGLQIRDAWLLLVALSGFAVLALAANGWLAQLKPPAAALTTFYFCLSIGGALGGVLNAILAPLIFHDTYEYPLNLLAISLSCFVLWQRQYDARELTLKAHALRLVIVLVEVLCFTMAAYLLIGYYRAMTQPPYVLPNVGRMIGSALQSSNPDLMHAASMGAFVALVLQRRYIDAFYACASVAMIMLLTMGGISGQKVEFKERNFFGVEWLSSDGKFRALMHNTTMHGMILTDPKAKLEAITYYYALHDVFDTLPVTHRYPFAVVGLGTGNSKCYAIGQQRVDLFDINPLVVRLAEDPAYFRYLRDCPGTYRILLGDGRIMLAKQKEHYGAIVLDAFSSDAIPTHLITREAIELYFDELVPHGVLLVHISNRHLALEPLLAAQAQALGLAAYGKVFYAPRDRRDISDSQWIILAKNEGDLALAVHGNPGWHSLAPLAGNRPWTDQYTNILPYLRLQRIRH